MEIQHAHSLIGDEVSRKKFDTPEFASIFSIGIVFKFGWWKA